MTTAEQLQEWLKATTIELKSDFGHLKMRPHITCPDGFKVSVQASAKHYCTPREHRGPWVSVECGFPSEHPEEWKEYREHADSPVYGYVLINDVANVLERHGWSYDKE